MSDDRSDRLRRRRKRASTSEAAEDREIESVARRGDHERSESSSVKDRQTGTYMYLPETQVKDLRRVYNIIKAEYEYQYGETFEKNRHFYPLVIRYGLDRLEGLDADKVKARLEELP